MKLLVKDKIHRMKFLKPIILVFSRQTKKQGFPLQLQKILANRLGFFPANVLEKELDKIENALINYYK